MTLFQRLKSWLRELKAAIEAIEEGPDGQIYREFAALDGRLRKLEQIADKS